VKQVAPNRPEDFELPPGLERLRILHVVPTLEIGGLERIATTLAIAFRDRVEHVAVCSPSACPFEDVLRDAGVHVELITAPRPEPRTIARSARDLRAIFRRERPHLVHAHNPAAALAAEVARRALAARAPALVTTYHGVADARLRQAAWILSRAGEVVIGCGAAATRELLSLGVPSDRTVTVANAITARPTRRPDEVRHEFGAGDAELVVNVGRYVEQKNQSLLLEALALLAPARPRLKALLVGSGPLESDLRRRVEELGLADVIFITGERADAADLMAAADLFVLSSSWEALPVTLLEAASLGRPIVATAVRGVVGTIRDGSNGLLVAPDSPIALADGIAAVLDDASLATKLGEGASAFAEYACAERTMLERYAVVYSCGLARRGRWLASGPG
jgi:glycosyltransferase involved in cell wall biosynthesis